MTPHFDLTGKRIFVAGHRGMIGSALVRRLALENCTILTADRNELDLADQSRVRDWMGDQRIDAVMLAAARVGGIVANDTYPADFLYDNVMIAANVIEAAHRAGVNRLINLGSSCIYPKFADQPITEEALLTGPLEPTNEAYAIAKIAAVKLTQAYRRQHGRDFISAMPTNLYGPGDNYHRENSHVMPALIRKVHEAKAAGADYFVLWGSGTPRREFLHADDCADACVFLLRHYSDDMHINVGSGEDIAIGDLAALIARLFCFSGRIDHDLSKPDGTPRKLMCNRRLRALGWQPAIALEDGIMAAYQDFLQGWNER